MSPATAYALIFRLPRQKSLSPPPHTALLRDGDEVDDACAGGAVVPAGVPFAIGQWADRKPENALRTLFSPFSLFAASHHPFPTNSFSLLHPSVTSSPFSQTCTHVYTTHVRMYRIYIRIYVRSCTRWRGRKYLISAESRKSQHRAFCVIKPRPQKLYAGYKTFVSTHSTHSPTTRASFVCCLMVPLGNANRNATHTRQKIKTRIHWSFKIFFFFYRSLIYIYIYRFVYVYVVDNTRS